MTVDSFVLVAFRVHPILPAKVSPFTESVNALDSVDIQYESGTHSLG